MAEYIEREALLELINEDCKYKNPTNEYTRGCNEVCDWAIKTIKNIPTADVVPKSEVDELSREYESLAKTVNEASELIRKLRSKVEKSKTEVAREIFEEIEKTIRGALVLVGFSYKHNPKEIQCKKECYEDFLGYIAELKKKYAEGAADNGGKQ